MLGRSVCIESLLFQAGTLSLANLHSQHCAPLLDSSLRTTEENIAPRISSEYCSYSRVGALGITYATIEIALDAIHTFGKVPCAYERTPRRDLLPLVTR